MPRDTPGAGGVSGISAREAHTRAQRAGVTQPERIVYVNLCIGTPYGDPEELVRALARHFGLKVLAIIEDDGDDTAVYARSKKVRERVFSALERSEESGEPLERLLAKRFPKSTILSVFDGQDTIIMLAER
jgi:hypothetical protein